MSDEQQISTEFIGNLQGKTIEQIMAAKNLSDLGKAKSFFTGNDGKPIHNVDEEQIQANITNALQLHFAKQESKLVKFGRLKCASCNKTYKEGSQPDRDVMERTRFAGKVHCMSCQIDFETFHRIQGTFKEYKKMFNIALAIPEWVEAMNEKDDYCAQFTDGRTTFIVNHAQSAGDAWLENEVWEGGRTNAEVKALYEQNLNDGKEMIKNANALTEEEFMAYAKGEKRYEYPPCDTYVPKKDRIKPPID